MGPLNSFFASLTTVLFAAVFASFPIAIALKARGFIGEKGAARIVFSAAGALFLAGVLPLEVTNKLITREKLARLEALSVRARPGAPGIAALAVSIPDAGASVRVTDPSRIAEFFDAVRSGTPVASHHTSPVHGLVVAPAGSGESYFLGYDSAVPDEYWLSVGAKNATDKQFSSPALSAWLKETGLWCPPARGELRRPVRLSRFPLGIIAAMSGSALFLLAGLILKRRGVIGSRGLWAFLGAFMLLTYGGQFLALKPMGRFLVRRAGDRLAAFGALAAREHAAMTVRTPERTLRIDDPAQVRAFLDLLSGDPRPSRTPGFFIPEDRLVFSFPDAAESYELDREGPGRFALRVWDAPDYGAWDELVPPRRRRSEELGVWLRARGLSCPDIPGAVPAAD